MLVRVTPGIEAETHEAIRTAHHGSKFGLPPEQALEAIRRAQGSGLDVAGLHVHIGSQLLDTGALAMTVDWLGGFAARCRDELDWTPSVADLGGGLGVRHVEDEAAPLRSRSSSAGSSAGSSGPGGSIGFPRCISCSSRDAPSSAPPG